MIFERRPTLPRLGAFLVFCLAKLIFRRIWRGEALFSCVRPTLVGSLFYESRCMLSSYRFFLPTAACDSIHCKPPSASKWKHGRKHLHRSHIASEEPARDGQSEDESAQPQLVVAQGSRKHVAAVLQAWNERAGYPKAEKYSDPKFV